MDVIATEFQYGNYRYRQVVRDGDIAIYAQRHMHASVERFEVVRICVRREYTWPSGHTTPEHEAYPGSATWGRDGWTHLTLAEAQAHMQRLIEGQTHEVS